MPSFAIYYIPEADSEFYKIGSAILGYDVRAEELIEFPSALTRALPGFNASWVSKASCYGFHLTIGPSVFFDLSDLPRIEMELSSILNCFATTDKMELRQCRNGFIQSWGSAVVLRYEPNDLMRFLHALVISRISTMGFGSSYLQSYLDSPHQYEREPHKAHRIKNFYNPFVLADYLPHFAVLNPYIRDDRQQVEMALRTIFSSFTYLEVNSVCLMVQSHGGEKWKVYKELSRSKH